MGILQAFADDTECNYYTYASEHFITQLENLDNGFTELADLLGHTESGSCSLSDSNEASDKPGGVPSSGEMMKVLQENDDIMKQICYMYAQDFICFDYELPSACEGLF